MAIRVAEFTYRFVFNDAINSVDEVMGMSLDEIMDECATGHMVGQFKDGLNITERALTRDEAVDVLVELGNDGTFFDNDEEEGA